MVIKIENPSLFLGCRLPRYKLKRVLAVSSFWLLKQMFHQVSKFVSNTTTFQVVLTITIFTIQTKNINKKPVHVSWDKLIGDNRARFLANFSILLQNEWTCWKKWTLWGRMPNQGTKVRSRNGFEGGGIWQRTKDACWVRDIQNTCSKNKLPSVKPGR